MRGASQQEPTRWQRLRPHGGADLALLGLLLVGLVLSAASLAVGDALGFGGTPAGLPVVLLLRLHGSTPLLAFFALALYLTRRGRSIGHQRRWVWAGFALTAPLWFLVGLPLSVRGLGDATVLGWLLNAAALALMSVGVWRTLGAAR